MRAGMHLWGPVPGDFAQGPWNFERIQAVTASGCVPLLNFLEKAGWKTNTHTQLLPFTLQSLICSIDNLLPTKRVADPEGIIERSAPPFDIGTRKKMCIWKTLQWQKGSLPKAAYRSRNLVVFRTGFETRKAPIRICFVGDRQHRQSHSTVTHVACFVFPGRVQEPILKNVTCLPQPRSPGAALDRTRFR